MHDSSNGVLQVITVLAPDGLALGTLLRHAEHCHERMQCLQGLTSKGRPASCFASAKASCRPPSASTRPWRSASCPVHARPFATFRTSASLIFRPSATCKPLTLHCSRASHVPPCTELPHTSYAARRAIDSTKAAVECIMKRGPGTASGRRISARRRAHRGAGVQVSGTSGVAAWYSAPPSAQSRRRCGQPGG